MASELKAAERLLKKQAKQPLSLGTYSNQGDEDHGDALLETQSRMAALRRELAEVTMQELRATPPRK